MNHDPILFGLTRLQGQSIGDIPVDMRITILIDGWLVSGTVVSREDYINSNLVLVPAAGAMDSFLASDASHDTLFDKETNFLHLRGAKFFSGKAVPIPDSDNTFFRCRFAAISGFFIGLLDVTPQIG